MTREKKVKEKVWERHRTRIVEENIGPNRKQRRTLLSVLKKAAKAAAKRKPPGGSAADEGSAAIGPGGAAPVPGTIAEFDAKPMTKEEMHFYLMRGPKGP